jgi:hypothetical protein
VRTLADRETFSRIPAEIPTSRKTPFARGDSFKPIQFCRLILSGGRFSSAGKRGQEPFSATANKMSKRMPKKVPDPFFAKEVNRK